MASDMGPVVRSSESNTVVLEAKNQESTANKIRTDSGYAILGGQVMKSNGKVSSRVSRG
jgi:hypothetical protein